MLFLQEKADILFEKQDGKCFWCGRPCQRSSRHSRVTTFVSMFTVDHVIPRYRYRGSDTDLENLVGSCWNCNQIRSIVENKIVSGKPLDDDLLQTLPMLLPVVQEEILEIVVEAVEKEPTGKRIRTRMSTLLS